MKHLARLLPAATLAFLGCPSTGTTPPAGVAPPAASSGSHDAPAVMSWVGTWTALSGAVQDSATVVMADGGRFRAEMQYGPDERCCLQGSYRPEGNKITFTLEQNTCASGAFTGYTRIWKREADRVVLAEPGQEANITTTPEGELEGPVWTFKRVDHKGDLASLKDCRAPKP